MWLRCIIVAASLAACRQVFGIDTTQLVDSPNGDASDAGIRDAPLVDGKLRDAPPDALAVPCTVTGLTCPGGATSSAVVCNGACWASCSGGSNASHNNVSNACANWGGKLAPLRTAADQACALTIFPGVASWIGLAQANGSIQLAVGWTWNNDSIAITYTNWASGQPNDGDGTENGAEQFAYMDVTGGWQDTTDNGAALSRYSCVK